MRNQDEVDLYRRVSVGTQVVVLDDAMRCAAYAPPSVAADDGAARKQLLPAGKARDRPTALAPRDLAARRWPLGLAELASCPSCASATEVGETSRYSASLNSRTVWRSRNKG